VSWVREVAADAFLKAVIHDGVAIQTVAHFGRHIGAELRGALELGAPPASRGSRARSPAAAGATASSGTTSTRWPTGALPPMPTCGPGAGRITAKRPSATAPRACSEASAGHRRDVGGRFAPGRAGDRAMPSNPSENTIWRRGVLSLPWKRSRAG